MKKLYYEIKDSYKQYDYVTTLEKIEKYLSIPGIGVDESLLLYYMNTMCRLGRIDDGYNIYKILDAIKISKKTCGIIKQNLIFSIGVKILVLLLHICLSLYLLINFFN